MTEVRYVAIGDSFTEGLGDELRGDGLPGDLVRGWADITAQGWADGIHQPIEYANLAIRGKLVWPIVDEQLDAALALSPTHLSFNGGGNDILRPRMTIDRIVDAFERVADRCAEAGVHLLLLSGANPSKHLPLPRLVQSRGDELAARTVARLGERPNMTVSLNWADETLTSIDFWSIDRLHLNARGHHRVAARLLTALEIDPPGEWWALPQAADPTARGWAYYRDYVGPWIGRRLTGRSSGDGRVAKFADWVRIEPGTRSAEGEAGA